MKTLRLLLALLTMMVGMGMVTACGSDSDDDSTPTPAPEGPALNTWVRDGSNATYYYKEQVGDMGLEVVHEMTFSFDQDLCTYASDGVHFDSNSLRDTYLSLHADFRIGNTGWAIREPDLFKNHTESEVTQALGKGDYTGATIVQTEPEPLYKVETLYGTWAKIRSVGKYTMEGDSFVFTTDIEQQEGDNREFLEFSEDGTVVMWHALYPEDTRETYPFSFNAYSATNYVISVNKGKKWAKQIRTLNSDRLVLYSDRTLHYNLGYTETFERVK